MCDYNNRTALYYAVNDCLKLPTPNHGDTSMLQACVGQSEDEVEWYVTTLLDVYVVSANPHVRQASSVWLLALVRRSSDHPALQSRLPRIQGAFMALLSENNGT